MKLPRTSKMTPSIYALAMASMEETPKSRKRKSGAMDVMTSSTAPVTHQRKTHASTPSMLPASWCPPSRSASAHTATHTTGPDATAAYPCMSKARTPDDDASSRRDRRACPLPDGVIHGSRDEAHGRAHLAWILLARSAGTKLEPVGGGEAGPHVLHHEP
ncbi:hypothetical protein EJB05_51899, partial [Eragrostis curvula]